MTHLLSVLLAALVTPVFSAWVSTIVGRHTALKVTQAELQRAEERAEQAQRQYRIAIDYLRQIAEWFSAHWPTQELPPPPPELRDDLEDD